MAKRDITLIPLRSTLESVGAGYHATGGIHATPISVRYLRKVGEMAEWPFAIHVDDGIYRAQHDLLQRNLDDAAWRRAAGSSRSYLPLLNAIGNSPNDRILIPLATGELKQASDMIRLALDTEASQNPALRHKKIIFTGAMKPMAGWGGARDARHRLLNPITNHAEFEDAPNRFNHGDVSHLSAYRTSDGYENLIYAVERLQDDAISPGVYVAMHGKLYEANAFIKNYSELTLEGTPVHEDDTVELPTRLRPHTRLEALLQEAPSHSFGDHARALLERALGALGYAGQAK